MLLRSALGMAIVMMLMGLAQNIWQFLILRALLGLLGGVYSQCECPDRHPDSSPEERLGAGHALHRSRERRAPWPAGGRLSCRPLGDCAPSSFSPPASCSSVFILTLFFIREQFVPVAKKEMLNARDVFSSLKSPKLVLSLFVTTMIIQVATGSIAPILTLYVRDLAGDVGNIAFISGMIASVPGVAGADQRPAPR
ncbi:drug efflux system protein MdtG [Raoultella planticola]|uniref:Drug efflux system protein MdtG n=1 Tax=Raoultella planticola TaxID=575 RepID=A0A485CU96_RAOPL|nr:drug efflux system protein MdtG [Raoultella planticola]